MTALRTTIAKEDSCPNIVVNNTTTYPANTSHDITNFNEYVRYSLALPNGMSVSFLPTTFPNLVEPPSDLLSVIYETCLVGLFTAIYTALPTPPESIVSGQSNEYTTNDNFYYNGVIYKVNAASIGIPGEGFTNTELIANLLAASYISVITESQINEKYTSEISFVSWCTLETCLLDKIAKLNCLIVAEPTRNDLCDKELYEQVLQLNFIKEFIDTTIMVEPYILTPELEYQIKSAANYVNSICCCKGKCCEDC